jgi:ornithine cyclodeaminase/alanine dehydrogenase-like protein (mu-crystallin family)
VPELRLLARDEVAALLPTVVEQIDLAEETYRALALGRVELPPKPGIHPRPNAFIHAMPAYLADDDIAAMKWVSGYPHNPARGLPYISGVIVVNNAGTGEPVAVLDAAEITAARTAAASGVCIRRFARHGWRRVGLLGCGEQGRYHVRVVEALEPAAHVRAWDPVPERAAGLPGPVEPVEHARAAVADAEILITAAPIVDRPQPTVAREWLGDEYLVLPLDFDASIQKTVIEQADAFAVDDVPQFEYYRERGHFAGWPRPESPVGELLDRPERPPRAAFVCLGIGALDAAFAAAVVRRAQDEGVGTSVNL